MSVRRVTRLGTNVVHDRRVDQVVDQVVDDVVADEAPLEIQLREHDGMFRSVAVVMRTPFDDDAVDEHLALGFLRTEGVIASVDDVEHVGHCSVAPTPEAEGNIIQVRLRPGVVVEWQRLVRHTFASSSCGVCGKASIDAVVQTLPPPSSSATRAAPTRARCLALTERLRAAQPLFQITGATHGALLVGADDAVIAVAEDVGRHNAVDVVIGAALRRRDVDWSMSTLVLSGRIAFEIVQKAAVVGIGSIVAVGAPTSLAIDLAQRAGITLVGFVRPRRANHYG